MKLQLCAIDTHLRVDVMSDDGKIFLGPLQGVVAVQSSQELKRDGIKSYILTVTVRVKQERGESPGGAGEDALEALKRVQEQRCIKCGKETVLTTPLIGYTHFVCRNPSCPIGEPYE